MALPTIPAQPRDFIICGPTCAGKSTLATFLAKEYGYCHLEASDFMYRAFWQRHSPRSTISIGTFAEAALREQPEIVAEQIRESIEDEKPRAFTVTGFRAPEEVQYLTKALSQNRRLQLIYVDAEPNLRFQRSKQRQREGRKLCREEFDKRDKQEVRMGLSKIKTTLNPIIIRNENTFESFYRQFGKLFSVDLRTQRKSPLAPWQHVPRHDLENIVLVTLASRKLAGQFFTTSEIAKCINEKLGKFKRRVQKDNVSRYFNQNFHPFFEIQMDGGKRKYRLSNTGIARARMLRVARFSYFRRRSPIRSREPDLYAEASIHTEGNGGRVS